MHCFICKKPSFHQICKSCRNRLLKPEFISIEIDSGFFCYSFFYYEDIEFLIKTKYRYWGRDIINLISKRAALSYKLKPNTPKFSIPIDDKVDKGFSHSALIANSFKRFFKPLYGSLYAQNRVQYAGKSLKFRQDNKKNFRYSGAKNIKTVLIDDIITTGSTIKEARDTLQNFGVDAAFALTLISSKKVDL